jgi:hypothetical protein
MQLAPTVSRTLITPAATEPDGWSPGYVDPAESSRDHGLLAGALSAWLGKPEKSDGAGLTDVQIDTFAPFYADRFHLPVTQVRADLEHVRVQVGGLAYHVPNMATTVGPNIYVADAGWATMMLSWDGRDWLAHELTHTMQWRMLGDNLPNDAARDRRFLNKYVVSFVGDDGNVGQGGFAQAIQSAILAREKHLPGSSFGSLMHDSHPMEHEAILTATAFMDAYPRDDAQGSR